MKSHARSRHQHTRYQNTMNPGIAIAVVGFIGTALILAGLFLVPALSLKKSSEQVVIPETPWAELQQKIEALNRAGASSEEMHRVLTDILKNDESLRRALIDSLPESLEIDGQGLRSRANEVKDVVTMPLRKMFPPTPDVRDTVQRGTILVVSDFRPPLDANVASELEYAYQRLSHLGYKLVGDVSLRHADRASDAYAEQDELVALARHEKGINRIDSPETCRTLQGWMNDHDSIKHVLWLSPSGDDTLLQYAAIGPTIVYADAPVKVSGDGETAVKIVNAVAQSSRSKR